MCSCDTQKRLESGGGDIKDAKACGWNEKSDVDNYKGR